MPRKHPSGSATREPLAFALGTPAKVSALRALAGAGEPLSQRDVARRAGVQHRSARLALDELVLLGIVFRPGGGGGVPPRRAAAPPPPPPPWAVARRAPPPCPRATAPSSSPPATHRGSRARSKTS